MSKGSSSGATQTENYMRRLADGLDALAPANRAEVLAEIRGHIADATTEAGGDEARALAGFGAPEEMATRILEERGMIAESPGLPAAPGWMRWTALAIDVASWALLLLFLLAMPLGIAIRVGTAAAVAGWAFAAVVAAGTVWWWGWKRRRRGHVSAGMNVLGIRRVRVAGTNTLVRAKDLGEPPRSKGELAGSIAWTVLIALVVGAIGYGMIAGRVQSSASDRQQLAQDVAQDVIEAERVVDNAYGAAIEGRPTSDWFAPQAASAAAELHARHAAGGFDSYSVDSVQLPDYKRMPWDQRGLERYTLTAVVDITESRGETGLAYYEYSVVKRITQVDVSGGATNLSWAWQIESVRHIGDAS